MPFDARVGNEMTYQAAKPTNWQPGMIPFDVCKEETFFNIRCRRLHTRRT
jgi:hypothetical protein